MSKGDAFASIGFGTLVGCLLGFSAQATLSGALVAVITLVAGFVGVAKPAAFLAAENTDSAQTARMAVFSLVATAAFLISQYVALNRYLDPSPTSLKAALTAAGYTEAEAKVMVGAKLYGVVPQGWQKVGP